jgi:hypothetical protein
VSEHTNAKNVRLFNQDGTRNVQAERQIQHVNDLRTKYESQALELAQKVHMLETVQHVPATDEEARQLHQEAQRTAAAMAHEVIQTLRSLMLTSKRATVQLDAAKALFEIGGRVRGGDGKSGSLPGANVIVIDRSDLVRELETRKAKGTL